MAQSLRCGGTFGRGTAGISSPWPPPFLAAVLLLLVPGVAQAAGADLWEVLKSLV